MKNKNEFIDELLDFQSIIVATIFQKEFQWFISAKEDWFLDYRKWPDHWGDTNELYFRNEIPVVDAETFSKFRQHLKKKSITTAEIHYAVLPYFQERDWPQKPELFPALYVNFDENVLRSVVPEGTPFEEFSPPGWDSEFGLFLDLIPPQNQYWIVDGKDLSKLIYPSRK